MFDCTFTRREDENIMSTESSSGLRQVHTISSSSSNDEKHNPEEVASVTQHVVSKKSSKWLQIKKQLLRNWQMYVILLLPVLNLIIFRYMPLAGLQIAFKTFRTLAGIWNSPFVGLKHFEAFFSSRSTMQIIVNTIGISLYSILASFPIAIMLAIALNECRFERYKKAVQMLTYAPYFISTVVLVSMLSQFLDPRIGIISMGLQQFGIETKNIMGEASLFKHIYVWSGVWQSSGYTDPLLPPGRSGLPRL